jgi:CRISPR system Cascade subunit CasE
MKEKLYASLLVLDRRAIRKLRITDPYSLHRVVYGLFEDIRRVEEKVSSRPSGIVYADQGGDFQVRRILILSNRPPREPLPEDSCRLESREIPESLFNFLRFRFKVMINPGRRNNRTRRIEPVRGRDEIAAWFCERAVSNWGFTVVPEHLQVEDTEILRFTGRNRNRITLARTTLQGVLEVTDTGRFRAAFAAGLGRGRAFGCGLLQIVPLQD